MQSRYSNRQPVVNYTLRIDTNDLAVFFIDMQIRNVPDTFRVAMVAHPEYDDRYWRFIGHMEVETGTGNGSVQRKDSAVWQIVAKGGTLVLHYQLRLPAPDEEQRASWRPFLSSRGGLAGGPHCFLYVVGSTLAPSHVTFNIPASWKIATGLEPTPDPYTFFAPSVSVLVDCPVLVGRFASSSFKVDGVPHQVVYCAVADTVRIDTGKLVQAVRKLVEGCLALFGRLPYRSYAFLFFDDAYGALEHANSVTIGARARSLQEDFGEVLAETAHEYFHAWNLVRIRPVERTDASYRTPPLSKGLWFSEGLTMYYADLLLRRAGLPTPDSTRTARLTRLLNRYYESDVYTTWSAEKISLAENGPAGMLGDFVASPHLQGELIGTLLDLLIRQSTHDERTMDDVMKKMLENFGGERGFTSHNVERTVQSVCNCDVHPFFRDYVFGARPIDFNRFLLMAGLHAVVTYPPVTDGAGQPLPDRRMYAWTRTGEDTVRAGISNPASCWPRAGLHTGDVLLRFNQVRLDQGTGQAPFWQAMRSVRIGDTVRVDVLRSGQVVQVAVPVTGFQQPDAGIKKLEQASPQQQARFNNWNAGR